jgi:hypothetical protein
MHIKRRVWPLVIFDTWRISIKFAIGVYNKICWEKNILFRIDPILDMELKLNFYNFWQKRRIAKVRCII